MAERDTTPVTINLSTKRPYRVNDSDRVAVEVGPGEVTVPMWVAVAWKMVEPQDNTDKGEATPPTPALPDGAVSATVETVEAEPLKTTETVLVVTPSQAKNIKPVGRDRSRR